MMYTKRNNRLWSRKILLHLNGIISIQCTSKIIYNEISHGIKVDYRQNDISSSVQKSHIFPIYEIATLCLYNFRIYYFFDDN